MNNITLHTASHISGISYKSLLQLAKTGYLITHFSNGIRHTKKDYFEYWIKEFNEQ